MYEILFFLQQCGLRVVPLPMVIGGRQPVSAGRCPRLPPPSSSYPCCCRVGEGEGEVGVRVSSKELEGRLGFLSPIATGTLEERPLWPFSALLLLLLPVPVCPSLAALTASAVLSSLFFSTVASKPLCCVACYLLSTSRGCFLLPPAGSASGAAVLAAVALQLSLQGRQAASTASVLPLESNGPCLKSWRLAGESLPSLFQRRSRLLQQQRCRRSRLHQLLLCLEGSCGLVKEAGFSGGYGFSLFNLDELGSHSFVDCSFDSSNKTKVAASVNLIVS